MIPNTLIKYIERVVSASLLNPEESIRSDTLHEGDSIHVLEDFAVQQDHVVIYAYVSSDMALKVTSDANLAYQLPSCVALIRREDEALDGSKPFHTQLYIMTISFGSISPEYAAKYNSNGASTSNNDDCVGMRKAFPLLGIQRVNKYLVTPAIAQVLKDSARGNEEGRDLVIEGIQKKR